MLETELAYAAAMVDGEGTISVCRNNVKRGMRGNYTVRVMVYNTDYRLIEWFNERWPGLVRKHHQGFIPKAGGLPRACWRWQLGGLPRTRPFLSLVYPYLILKRRRAELALAMLDASHPTSHNYTPTERAARDAVYAQWMADRAA